MLIYLYEFIGTALLILIGNGVVANLVLKGTKGPDTGWTGISLAWGIAVFIGVYVSADVSHAHLNPAVTLALATAGKFSWGLVPGYMVAQVLGAMMGNFMIWLSYKKHYDATEDQGAILATFCTGPAIRSPFWNFVTEAIGTFTLVFGIFFIAGGSFGEEAISLGALDALPVALLVMGIGFGLGGPTGYAINPARDFGPRLLHSILPLKGKSSSDWGYAWIPIIAPLFGAFIAALAYLALSV
ncbi:MIP/aquaporin family protein [Zobellia roscoffensis]|uniref:MIP/aquaporin family protein n=1 Tax=Zobellia roscoffensis TaxID=2779508 RepID=UPI00188D9C38|nr:MIP/aquaporin family protein [Zobellia roscoffensis]